MAMNAPVAQPTVAPGASRSQLVLAGGLLLIAANLAAEPAFRTIFANAFRGPGTSAPLAAGWASTGLLDLGLELLVVLVLYIVASVSETVGALAVAILAAMWLVFLLRHAPSSGQSQTTQNRA